jgi:hypothetical protein
MSSGQTDACVVISEGDVQCDTACLSIAPVDHSPLQGGGPSVPGSQTVTKPGKRMKKGKVEIVPKLRRAYNRTKVRKIQSKPKVPMRCIAPRSISAAGNRLRANKTADTHMGITPSNFTDFSHRLEPSMSSASTITVLPTDTESDVVHTRTVGSLISAPLATNPNDVTISTSTESLIHPTIALVTTAEARQTLFQNSVGSPFDPLSHYSRLGEHISGKSCIPLIVRPDRSAVKQEEAISMRLLSSSSSSSSVPLNMTTSTRAPSSFNASHDSESWRSGMIQDDTELMQHQMKVDEQIWGGECEFDADVSNLSSQFASTALPEISDTLHDTFFSTAAEEEDSACDPDDSEPLMCHLENLDFVELASGNQHGSATGSPSAATAASDHDAFMERLHRGLIHVPVVTAQHESRLLVASGPNDPMCRNKNGCVGRCGTISGLEWGSPGYILLPIMTPEELNRLRQFGELPTAKRTCVLCNRHNMNAIVNHIRSTRGRNKDSCIVDKNVLLQRSRVLMELPGGYKQSHVLASDPGAWEGFQNYVVSLKLNYLSWRQRKTDCIDGPAGQWYVDQSQLIYTGRTAMTPDASIDKFSASEVDIKSYRRQENISPRRRQQTSTASKEYAPEARQIQSDYAATGQHSVPDHCSNDVNMSANDCTFQDITPPTREHSINHARPPQSLSQSQDSAASEQHFH